MNRNLKTPFSLLLVVGILIGTTFFFVSCGTNTPSTAGTWYNTTDPDSDPLVLTEDGTYIIGDEGGSYTEEDGEVYLVPESSFYDAKTLSIGDYEENVCLYNENGELLLNNYDAAVEYYSETANKRADDATSSIVGEYSFRPDAGIINLTVKEDGTYYYETDNDHESGTWTVETGPNASAQFVTEVEETTNTTKRNYLYGTTYSFLGSCTIGKEDGSLYLGGGAKLQKLIN